MIAPINNTMSFKGFYSNKNTQFNESQQKVVDDIKAKLKDESIKNDFFINPGKYKDSVYLAQVYDLKNKGTGVDKYQTYTNKLDIGTYDEEHLFNLEDLNDAKKADRKNTITSLISIVAIGIFTMACILAGKSNKQFIQMPTPEHKTSIIKDTIVSDSSKILKDAFIKK